VPLYQVRLLEVRMGFKLMRSETDVVGLKDHLNPRAL
jgi:hypothetical protein